MTSTKRNIINGILALSAIGLLIFRGFFNFISFKLTMTIVYGFISVELLVWAYFSYKNNLKKNTIKNLILAMLLIIFNVYVFLKY